MTSKDNGIMNMLISILEDIQVMEPALREDMVRGAWESVADAMKDRLLTHAEDKSKPMLKMAEEAVSMGMLSLYFKHRGDWAAMLETARKTRV